MANVSLLGDRLGGLQRTILVEHKILTPAINSNRSLPILNSDEKLLAFQSL
ncbi:MAG: hypothetical protein AAFQ80_20720 [Cyanobacteria bacterium J06621_8]